MKNKKKKSHDRTYLHVIDNALKLVSQLAKGVNDETCDVTVYRLSSVPSKIPIIMGNAKLRRDKC